MSAFNVVIATGGRKSLKRTVESILPQLRAEDYLTVIFDGCEVNHKLFTNAKCTVNIHHEPTALGFWGHGARNKYQDSLPGDYILNGDDDDIWTPNAMSKIREACTGKKLYIFQFAHNGHGFPVRSGQLGRGKCGTPNGVYANIGNFPKWEECYGGDGDFYENLAKRLEPEWVKEIIYIIRPKIGSEFDLMKPANCGNKDCNGASFYSEVRTASVVYTCRKCGRQTKINKRPTQE